MYAIDVGCNIERQQRTEFVSYRGEVAAVNMNDMGVTVGIDAGEK